MRGLLWRCWSECSLIECVDVVLFVIELLLFGRKRINVYFFAHHQHFILNQLSGEDTKDYEWDHVTSHSTQHS